MTDVLAARLLETAESARQCEQRQLIACSGPADWRADASDRIRQCLPDLLHVDPGQHRPQQLIGRDLRHVLLDLGADLAPDLLGAAAGALGAGHLLICLLPACDQLADTPFGARLMRVLKQDPHVLWLTPTETRLAQQPPRAIRPQPQGDCLSPDQQAAVAAIMRVVTGRARRPLVITADRGRGKSAALGLAARKLAAEQAGPLLLTAPSAAAAAAALHHAGQDAVLRFMPPDALARELPDCRTLFVDEAAALPVPLLARLLRHYGRLVFATTEHGYEGMGRGFSLRFRRLLDSETPAWRSLKLHAPLRFGHQDVLEPLITRALCLDADPGDPPEASADMRIRWLQQAELATDETLVNSVFGLLVLAHYRTRPADLRQLLDDPAVRIAIMESDQRPVGCLLMVAEGGQSAELAAAMAEGRRRPRGQHGAGILAAQMGLPAGAQLCSLRVARVVVHPALQRQGLGQQLLSAAIERARAEGMDFVSSTFGGTRELVRFWGSRGFRPAWVGQRRAARSGEHGILVLHGLTPAGQLLQQQACDQLQAELPAQLGLSLGELDPALAWSLLTTLPTTQVPERAREQARRWLAGAVSLDAVPGSVEQLLCTLARCQPANMSPDCNALVARLLQHRPWPEVVAMTGSTGRRSAEDVLRRQLLELLEAEQVSCQDSSGSSS